MRMNPFSVFLGRCSGEHETFCPKSVTPNATKPKNGGLEAKMILGRLLIMPFANRSLELCSRLPVTSCFDADMKTVSPLPHDRNHA